MHNFVPTLITAKKYETSEAAQLSTYLLWDAIAACLRSLQTDAPCGKGPSRLVD